MRYLFRVAIMRNAGLNSQWLLIGFALLIYAVGTQAGDAGSSEGVVTNEPAPDTNTATGSANTTVGRVAPAAPAILVQEKKPITRYPRSAERLLESKGFEFHGFLKSEVSTDFHSGFTGDGTDTRSLVETSVTLDLNKAVQWKGARFSASFHDYFGTNATNALVGDVQGFSNIDARPMNRIYEMWFEQTLDRGKVRIKVGRIDANTEFAYVENAGDFLNSSMGFSPTILA